jgi:transcriptional regulator with XRE-family HTH domain/HPt (histidine-containing phosphotransfer) domain-containing protein
VPGDRNRQAEAESVGARIRRLRLARGLSQKELAGPDFSDAHISRIESGSRKPSLSTLRYIASRLGVDPETLESGATVPASKERELRLADAELSLRFNDDLDHAEGILLGLLAEEIPDGLEARIRATLGTIRARRGDYVEATRQLEGVIASGAFHPCTRPDVYETLSRAYLATGSPVLAIKLLEGAIETADSERRFLTQQVRFRVFLATALSAVGAFERAQEVLQVAAERADELEQPGVRVSVEWEKARVAWNKGDSEAALAGLTYARALADLMEDSLLLGQLHLLASQMLTGIGRPAEAREHLEQAEPALLRADDAIDRGLLRCEAAKVEAALGDPSRALAFAEEADRLLGGHVRHRANGRHALAVAHAALGRLKEAEPEFEEAIELLLARGQWREASSIARDWAKALQNAGRDREALAILDRAIDFPRHQVAATEAL